MSKQIDWNKIYSEFEAEIKQQRPPQPQDPEIVALNRRIEAALDWWMDASEVDEIVARMYAQFYADKDEVLQEKED